MESKNRLKLSFIWAYVFGLIAHGYVYLNTTFSHDGSMIYLTDDEWKISIGRYMGVFYRIFRSRYSAPWLTGVLAIGYLALCAFVIVEIFEISRPAIIAAISACFATNYSLIFMNADTIHESDTYMLAALLYVIGAYFILIGRKSLKKSTEDGIGEKEPDGLEFIWNKLIASRVARIVFAAVAIGLAIGIYQAYVTMTFAIVVVAICIDCLNNEKFKIILDKILDSIVAYIGGAIIYVIGLKIYTAVTGVAMYEGGHNSISTVFTLDGWHPIDGLMKGYSLFFHQFFDISTKFNYKFLVGANIVLIFGTVALTIAIAIKKKITKLNLLIITLSFVLVPGILGALYILTLIGHIMMCQYIIVYVFPLVLVDYLRNTKDIIGKAQDNIENGKASGKKVKVDVRKIASFVCLLCTFVVVYYSVTFANAYYLEEHLEYQSTREYMSNLINDIERTPGYVAGETEVLFVGVPQWSHNAHERDGYFGFEMDSKGWNYEYTYSITGYYTYIWFVNQVMNANIVIGPEEEAITYSLMPEVTQMPEYPSADSIVMYDGKIIAKVGNWY